MAKTPTPAAGAKPTTPPTAPAQRPPDTNPGLLGTDKLDALIRVGETDVQLGEFVRAAFEAAAPMTAEEWNALSDDDRHARILAQVDGARAEAADHADDGDLVEARALVAFGDYAADDVVTGKPSAIAALEGDGKVDTHPDAVAFAKSLQAD